MKYVNMNHIRLPDQFKYIISDHIISFEISSMDFADHHLTFNPNHTETSKEI